ncbi:MAG: carboxylesterase family protein [Lachnospiraceae bacterium]|nr:carboxylesterase family protein [Lachnospiraceae bacterium]
MYMKQLKRQVICTYDDPVAETKYGKLRGLKVDSTYIFRGIKYADARRFHMPVEVKPWEGVREAFQYRFVCHELNTPVPHDQFTVPHFFYPQNEDCQYLNVWTQHLDANAKKPVMVWLHGGGWFSGSSVELLSYDGENLSAAEDVVVVSVNHRLNVLGYLDLSQYGDEYKNSANVGLADLVMALKWVNENIANFGGDPDNVTIFGQSGGGGKVVALMQTPAADGLYHRAIMESGGVTGEGGPEAVEKCREVNQKAASLILHYLNIPAEEVSKIEEVDWYDLAQATMNAIYTLSQEGNRVGWEPLPDGDYYLGHPLDYGWRKENLHIPMLVGSVLGEFSGNFDRKIGDQIKNKWDEETLEKHLTEFFDEKKDEMVQLFREAYPERNPADVLFLDTRLRRGCLNFTRDRAKAGGDIWNWMFNLESPFNYGTVAWHNAEECYVFRNAAYIEAQYIPGVSERLQDQMSGAWVQFARSGDPNFPLIPQWPKVTPESIPTMRFDEVTDLRVDYDRKLMAQYPDPPQKGFPGSGKMYAIFGVEPAK